MHVKVMDWTRQEHGGRATTLISKRNLLFSCLNCWQLRARRTSRPKHAGKSDVLDAPKTRSKGKHIDFPKEFDGFWLEKFWVQGGRWWPTVAHGGGPAECTWPAFCFAKIEEFCIIDKWFHHAQSRKRGRRIDLASRVPPVLGRGWIIVGSPKSSDASNQFRRRTYMHTHMYTLMRF